MSVIDVLYAALDRRPRESLGMATSVDMPAPESGLIRHYAGGAIMWHPRTGAHEVYGDIYARWSALGEFGSGLGYPTTGEQEALRGRVSHFERGDIYWAGASPAYVVYANPSPCTAEPARFGHWDVPGYGSGVVGVHAALVPPGRILFFTFKPPADPRAPSGPQRYGASSVLNLRTGVLERPSYVGPLSEQENLFCSGHALLGDGRLLIAGGEREAVGVRDEPVRALHVYDSRSTLGGTLSFAGNMIRPRWYATCATLPDGRLVIVGGSSAESYGHVPNSMVEVYDPARGRTEEVLGFLDIVRYAYAYPILFVLPDHRLLVHAGFHTRLLTLPSFAVEPGMIDGVEPHSRTYNVEGSAVLLPLLPDSVPPYRARVFITGGGRGDINTPATATSEILDLGEARPAWRAAAPMAHPRVMPDAVLLPDGTVLVVNGSDKGHADGGASPVFDAELYDPMRDEWTRLCNMTIARLYHATALLLPDGRVMTAGTDASWNPPPFNTGELRLEYFSPPYLFRGARPSITEAPEVVAYGARFEVRTPDAFSVSNVALMRCGSVTHSVNTDQRYVGVRISNRESGSITLEAPPDGYVAPPGYYLLFVLRDGVPSVGRFMRLGDPAVFHLDVPAETGGRLMGVPGFGEVLVAASNPASSSNVRFLNTTLEIVDLEQRIGADVMINSLMPGAVHTARFDVIDSTNNFALSWNLRRGERRATLRIAVVNAPHGENRCTFDATIETA